MPTDRPEPLCRDSVVVVSQVPPRLRCGASHCVRRRRFNGKFLSRGFPTTCAAWVTIHEERDKSHRYLIRVSLSLESRILTFETPSLELLKSIPDGQTSIKDSEMKTIVDESFENAH